MPKDNANYRLALNNIEGILKNHFPKYTDIDFFTGKTHNILEIANGTKFDQNVLPGQKVIPLEIDTSKDSLVQNALKIAGFTAWI